MRLRSSGFVVAIACALSAAASEPARGHGGVVASSDVLATRVGVAVLRDGGTATDAAVATAFALAVVHPTAGNIGGGGFLLQRSADGRAAAHDFRETALAAASATMFLKDGRYDEGLHHTSYLSVGVPGTVAGLYLAWSDAGRLPWKRLVTPAIELARDGFSVSDWLARDLAGYREEMARYPATLAIFSKSGAPYAPGDVLRQADLARTLERIADGGPAGFYAGETARLVALEMQRGGGLVSEADLAAYRAQKREPLRGSYRGYEIVGMPPPSSGGAALIEMLNVAEGWDLAKLGWGSALYVHRLSETMRRAYADRARYLGDPGFNRELPIARLLSKDYAAGLRGTIVDARASVSAPDRFDWPAESAHTTHLSVADAAGNAVALTFTIEDDYGSKIVVPGAGFLLNNEMGDFNAGPGLTTDSGLIGTEPNLAAPGKRMLSSMTPTIVTKDGRLVMALGAAGGRRIINTVLEAIVNVVDFGMNLQEAIDVPRFHHQWLPDQILVETRGLSPDTIALLRAKGHVVTEGWDYPSRCQAVGLAPDGRFEGADDRRYPDSAALTVAP